MDGFLSSSMYYVYMKAINPNIKIKPFFHDKNPKSHGLGDDDIFKRIKKELPSLLVILDAGSNDDKECKKLKSLGYEIILADHHKPEDWSNNGILVNNHMSEDVVNKGLCGTGVTWKCLKRYDELYGYDIANSLISYVSFANVSDSMNMTYQENRAFAKWGFKRIHKNLKPFFDEFVGDDITNESIVWNVTPKGNALIRLGSLEDKTNLFYSLCGEIDPTDVIEKMKSYHSKQNADKPKLMEQVDVIYNGTCILAKIKAKTSLTGLIANNLSSQYLKPILLVHDNEGDGSCGGSCRSVVPIKKQLLESGLFEHCDGHEDFAFGISYSKKNESDIINYLDTSVTVSEPYREVLLSTMVNCIPNNLYGFKSAYNDLWSKGISSPVVHIQPFEIDSDSIRLLGKNKRTLKFTSNGIDFLMFRISNKDKELFHLEEPNKKLKIECIVELGINEYRGVKKKQALIQYVEVEAVEVKEIDWEGFWNE